MPPLDLRYKDAVLKYLQSKSARPLKFRELALTLRVQKKNYKTLKRVLRSLITSGEIFKTKAGHYGLSREMNLITGSFEGHRDGYGFVIADKPDERDIFIPPRKTAGAMSGDRIVARVENPVRREGSIIRILERGRKRITGELVHEGNAYYVRPKNRKFPFYIFIGPKFRGKAQSGDTVVAELTSYPVAGRPPEGKVVKIMPPVTEPSLETAMIIEEYALPLKFPAAVQAEARQLTEDNSLKKRKDCRSLLTVTIDGETAKDFDDAITISKSESGFLLHVHIADVSHYVTWGSSLDIEARKRGTSVYFPGSVIPMLPEKLSNNLCSLVPKKDRPAFTVEMEFDFSGRIRRKSFYPSMINSNERMTYTSVKKILVDHDPEERGRYKYLLESFRAMEELAGILRKIRMKRGSLDFDLPEPEIILDIQGNPEAICASERNLAHMIIEEFMITANEVVASHLEEIGVPSLYRIHEKPDTAKLDELIPIFSSLGFRIKKTGPGTFQSILKKIKGSREENILNILLLRSLKQAKYLPDNIGHFGLASQCYTHFTSPIRRYPDLIVHRILKESLERKGLSESKRKEHEKILPDIAIQSSKTERTAEEAEREIVNAMRVWFMKDKVGDEFEGVISGLNPRGLKVKLNNFFVEGFLNVSSMSDDYYRFDERNYRLIGRRNKVSYKLGQAIKVRLEKVDTEERSIVFGLV
jgi:ribonuclease R